MKGLPGPSRTDHEGVPSRGGDIDGHNNPLADESRDRYLSEWDRIEMRFVDAPEEAVREADAIVMSVLRERRHPLETRMLPDDVHAARKDASRGRGDRTEGMRRAMLRYRAVMQKMVSAARQERSRREMA